MPSLVVERTHPHPASSTVPWSSHRGRRSVHGPFCWLRGSMSTAATTRRALARLDEVIAAAAQDGQRRPARRRPRLEGAGVLAAGETGAMALDSAQGATVALEGQADSAELARALARLVQIEMLRGSPVGCEHRVPGDRGGAQDGGDDGRSERADESVHRAVGRRRRAGDRRDAGHRRAGARVRAHRTRLCGRSSTSSGLLRSSGPPSRLRQS